MISYELHAIDPSKLFTEEINITDAKSHKFNEYDIAPTGQIIIDKNLDLTATKRLINLITEKYSQFKFDTVIDIEFKEFKDNKEDINQIAQINSELDTLKAEKIALQASKDIDQQKIAALTNQIDTLQKQVSAKSNTEQSVMQTDRTVTTSPEARIIPNNAATDPNAGKTKFRIFNRDIYI